METLRYSSDLKKDWNHFISSSYQMLFFSQHQPLIINKKNSSIANLKNCRL
jgi:hypothetical protein